MEGGRRGVGPDREGFDSEWSRDNLRLGFLFPKNNLFFLFQKGNLFFPSRSRMSFEPNLKKD